MKKNLKRPIGLRSQQQTANESRYMLELNNTAVQPRSKNRGTKDLVKGLAFGGSLLFLSQMAPAAPAISTFNYAFKANMTNGSADPDARGTIQGNLSSRGTTEKQKLTITVSKLATNATYHNFAFLDESTVPAT